METLIVCFNSVFAFRCTSTEGVLNNRCSRLGVTVRGGGGGGQVAVEIGSVASCKLKSSVVILAIQVQR